MPGGLLAPLTPLGPLGCAENDPCTTWGPVPKKRWKRKEKRMPIKVGSLTFFLGVGGTFIQPMVDWWFGCWKDIVAKRLVDLPINAVVADLQELVRDRFDELMSECVDVYMYIYVYMYIQMCVYIYVI
jgi:hypothetical protein